MNYSKMDIINHLDNLTTQVAKLFCEKHDYYFEGWIGDKVGGIFYASDYFVNFQDAKYDVMTNQPEDMFLEWYDYSLEYHMDFESLVMGVFEKHSVNEENQAGTKGNVIWDNDFETVVDEIVNMKIERGINYEHYCKLHG